MVKKDIKELIKLNKIEIIQMTKEYLLLYLQSLLQLKEDRANRKILLHNLKKYIETINLENYNLYKIIENIKLMSNKDIDELLDVIDCSHKLIYEYYESILCEYEYSLETKDLYRSIMPLENIEGIKERENDILLGLLMSEKDLDTYYKNEEAYLYLKENTTIINGDTDENMDFYGCYLIEEEDKLKKIKIYVPKIKDLKTMLINIHEYKHGICIYQYLGKKVPDDDYEIMAKYEEEKFKENYLRKIKK